MKTEIKELQKQFEATGYISWLNSDLYPDGKIYSKEYTEWLENKTKELQEQLAESEQNLFNVKIESSHEISDLTKQLDEYCHKTEGFEIHVKQLQEQLAEKTEALENSENGMLNLIKYKNELAEQLAVKEKECEDKLINIKRKLENEELNVYLLDTQLKSSKQDFQILNNENNILLEQLAKKNNGWISVEDILPNDEEWVIITNGTQVVTAQYYKHSNEFALMDKVLKVTHWMLLPTPPSKR